MKLMHSAINSVNLNDDILFQAMHNQIKEMCINAKTLNETVNGITYEQVDDGMTRFPNGNYGTKGRDAISKKRKGEGKDEQFVVKLS